MTEVAGMASLCAFLVLVGNDANVFISQVPKDTKVEAPKPSLTPEQLKAKQQELRYKVGHS